MKFIINTKSQCWPTKLHPIFWSDLNQKTECSNKMAEPKYAAQTWQLKKKCKAILHHYILSLSGKKVTKNQRRMGRMKEQSCTDPGFSLHDREESLNANADTHTWHFLAIRVKHSYQAIIATAPCNTPHPDMFFWIAGSLGVAVTCNDVSTWNITPVNTFKICHRVCCIFFKLFTINPLNKLHHMHARTKK